MDVRVRKFYYKIFAYKGEAFHFQSIPANNFSEALEKAISDGVGEQAPDEVHIRKTQAYTMI